MGTREIVLSAVVPALVGIVLLLGLHFLLKKKSAGAASESAEPEKAAVRGPVLLAALFVLLAGAGTVLGSYAWQSRVELWADSVTHRFPAIALAAALVGLLGVLLVRRWATLCGVLGALGGAFAGWAVLEGLHESLIGETERWAWVAGLGLIAGVQAWTIELGARRLPGWRAPALVWLVVGVGALGATAGLANAPLVGWPLAAAAFGLAAVGVLRRQVNLLAGAGPAIAVVYVGMLAMSNWFGGSEEQWLMFGLLAAGPAGIGVAALPWPSKTPSFVRLIAAGAVSLALVGAQAAVSVPALMEASKGGGDDYYDY